MDLSPQYYDQVGSVHRIYAYRESRVRFPAQVQGFGPH